MIELVRVASLAGYFETMAGFGINPRQLLREQGLSAGQLVNPDQLIPARAAIRLLERSAAATECITLGLRMAQGRALANLSAISLLIAHQPNLRQALAALSEFRARINSTLVFQVEEHGGEAILREEFALRRPEPARQSSDLALGVLMKLCSSMLGENWQPRTVCFSHQAPPQSELGIFSRLFRCRVQFDQEFDGIVIAAADLDRTNPQADAQLARQARHLIEAQISPAERTIVQEVEELVALLLPSGRATVQTCAASLGLTVRTLQRRFDAEGDSFSALLHRIRMQRATQYLANPRMRVTDVAQMLGYGSLGAFTRWHSQTFGKPPLQWRKFARLP